MKRYQFMRLHIPTRSASVGEIDARDQRHLLDELNRYNAGQPGTWQYWATPSQLVSGRLV